MEDKKTILVIEDNPSNMKLAADLLVLNGFNVLKAVDGESALTILKDSVPDLILLDIQLPKMNGFEVLKNIRADNRLDSTKIVALTAQAMSEDAEKIKKAGFDYYVTKPINIKDFIAQVKDIVRG